MFKLTNRNNGKKKQISKIYTIFNFGSKFLKYLNFANAQITPFN